MKKIVVPVDFSGNSVEAAKQAGYIAKNTGAQVVLVHWYGRPYSVSFDTMTSGGHAALNVAEDEHYKKDISAKMDSLLKNPELEGVSSDKLLIYGTDVEEILKMDVLKDTHMYVIGKTGTSEFQETILGSTASDVIRFAKAPVLTVDKCTDLFG